MDVMQLTNDNSDVKAEDERNAGKGRVYLQLKIEDWRKNNDYCKEEFRHICRGGVLPVGETSRSDRGGGVSAEECSSRNVCEDDINMRSKSIFP